MPYQPDILDEGASGLIIPMPDGGAATVRKKMRHGSGRNRGHDLQTQKRLHSLAARTLVDNNNFEILRTPYLVDDEEHPDWYIMERIQTERPLWLGDPDSRRSFSDDPERLETLERELVRFWGMMWDQGFAPWDFELYLQRSGRVMVIDYDKWGFRRTDGYQPITMPIAFGASTGQPSFHNFFTHPCFPPEFPRRLLEERGCQVPQDLGSGTPQMNPRH